MADIIICAENSVTRAGLAAMATTSSNQVIAQSSNLLAMSRWLQGQRADLAVVLFSSVGESEWHELIQMMDDFSDSGDDEEGLSVLLMLDQGHELSEAQLRQLCTEMLNTGLVSILPMAVSANQMRDAIAAILNGLTIFHPDITEALFAPNDAYFPSLKGEADNLTAMLTAREVQVLNQLANGLTNRAIAQALDISEHTVKFHVSAIFSKLSVASRTEAVAIGIRTGLIML
jgi:two-component system, NarL family, response regulator YdfI